MKKLLLVGVAICVSAAFAEGVSTWKGVAGAGGVAEWNNASNWTPGVPDSDGTAVLRLVNDGKPVARLAPPSDFVGIIVLSNGVPDGVRMAFRAALTVVENASWTVKSAASTGGWLIATPGIASRIDAAFNGTIEVPKGIMFEVPANLTAAPSIVGAGEVILASAEQLPLVAGFAGTIRFNGSVLSAADVAALMNRNFTLGEGQTLDLSERTLALSGVHALQPLDDADAWSFNATTWTEGDTSKYAAFSTEFPRYDADGSLKLVDDPAQNRIVIYKARMFSVSDSWGVSYTHDPTLPANSRFVKAGVSQVISGRFAVGLQHFGATMPPPSNRKLTTSKFYGAGAYYYRNDSAQSVHWINNGYDGNMDYRESVMDGIDLRKPYDVTITCIDCILTVTLVQGEKSLTMRRNLTNTIRTYGDGMWLTLQGASDWWDPSNAIPWMTHTIRNFRGWYRNRVDAPWQTHASASNFLPIDSAKWKLQTLDMVNAVTNDASYFLGGGDVYLKKYLLKQYMLLHSKNKISIAKRCLVSMDLESPQTSADSAATLTFGFCEWSDGNWQSTLIDTTQTPNVYRKEWDSSWPKGWGFRWNFWQSTAQGMDFKLFQSTVVNNGKRSDVSTFKYGDAPIISAGSVAHIDFLYDAAGTVYAQLNVSNKTSGAGYARSYSQTLTPERFQIFKTDCSGGAYLDLRTGGQNPSSRDYGPQELILRNFRIRELTANANPNLAATVAVAAGASSSLTLGATDTASSTPAATVRDVVLGQGSTLTVASSTASAKAAVGNVTVSGAATLAVQSGAAVSLEGLTLSGEANASSLAVTGTATADELTVVVPSAWRKYRAGKVTLVSGLSVDPANVTLCDENGPIPEKKGNVVLENGVLKADFQRGMVLIFR